MLSVFKTNLRNKRFYKPIINRCITNRLRPNTPT